MRWTLTMALVLASLSFPAVAEQQSTQSHEGMGKMEMHSMPGMSMQDMTEAQKEFHESMQKMDTEMMQGMMEANPEKSWLKQMIAHHQGAIDMSEIILKHTKDEKLREAAVKTKEQNGKDKKELEAILHKE